MCFRLSGKKNGPLKKNNLINLIVSIFPSYLKKDLAVFREIFMQAPSFQSGKTAKKQSNQLIFPHCLWGVGAEP